MMKLDGVVVFVAVADGGSISEAARRLGLSKSVVSDRLVELEGGIGARLVQRTTRRMSLTEDGTAFLVRARRIVHDMTRSRIRSRRATRRACRTAADRRAGELRQPASRARRSTSFLAQHPGIDLVARPRRPVRRCGCRRIRRGGTARSGGRFAADGEAPCIRAAACLSRRPDLSAAHGMPRSIAELETCPAVLYANRETDWRFAGPSGWQTVRPRARLRVNNGLVMRDAALAGLGLTLLPSFLVYREIAAREPRGDRCRPGTRRRRGPHRLPRRPRRIREAARADRVAAAQFWRPALLGPGAPMLRSGDTC